MRVVRVLPAVLLAACTARGAATGTATTATAPSVPVPTGAFSATVVRVVDGDTLVARRDGGDLRVRLLGVDTPETVADGTPVRCYGPEASARTTGLLPAGTVVRAAYETSRTDRFGRELWDVWLPDGRFLAGLLVAEGYARVQTVWPNTTYADALGRAQAAAVRAGAGLWGPACRGNSFG